MRIRLNTVKIVAFATVVLCCVRVHGEKGPLTPEELLSTATHVVVGKVRAIYTRSENRGDWDYTRYLAEILPLSVEKGEGLSTKQPVYVRYWQRHWLGDPNQPPEATFGHWGLPSVNDTVRVYLARAAYDGITSDNKDGGLNVVFGDGFQILKGESAKTERTATRRPSEARMKGVMAATKDLESGILKQMEYPALPYSPADQEFIRLLKSECGIVWEVAKSKSPPRSNESDHLREEVDGYNDVMEAEIEHRFGRDIFDTLRRKAQSK